MSDFLSQPWFIWALAITAGFPLLAALLGQVLGKAETSKSPVATSLWYAVNFLLPASAFYLIFRYVAGTASENTSTRILLTTVLVLAIYVGVAIFNAVFFASAPRDTWRGRTPRLLRDIILGIMVAVGGAVVLAQVWQQDVTALVTALGIGSVILGFALQETLGNVMLGLSLLMERPFSEGDEILIGDHEGLVEEINWRATRIEVDGDIVIIPHAIAAKETIVNLSRPRDNTPVSVTVGFSYTHPPNQIRAMLDEALAATEGATVRPEKPELGVFVEEFADSSINYKVQFLAASAELKEKIIDRFMTRVWYAAQRNGFNIPFPIRTVYNHDADSIVSDPGGEALTQLKSSKFLTGSIDPDSLDKWVREARLEHYSDGETVVRQDEQVPSLYIVIAGSALMKCLDDDGRLYELYELGRGEFFGETTVLSGTDSPYSVEADGDLEVLAVPTNDMHRLVENKPSLAIEIGQIMEIRRKAVASAGHR